MNLEVYLREYKPKDAYEYFMLETQAIADDLGTPKPKSLEYCNGLVDMYRLATQRDIGRFYAIACATTDRFVGHIELSRINRRASTCNIAYFVGEPYRRMGAATYAIAEVVRIWREEMDLAAIVTTVRADNSASIHVLERNGFRLREVLPAYNFGGRVCCCYVLAIEREAYK